MLSFIKNLFAKAFGKSEPVQQPVVVEAAVEAPKGWPYDEPAKVVEVSKPRAKAARAVKPAKTSKKEAAPKAVKPSVKAKSVRKPKPAKK